MTDISILCSFIADLKYSDLPQEVIDYTGLLIADHYVSAVAGFIYNREFNKVIEDICNKDYNNGKCTVLFDSIKTTAFMASFMNAVYCHGADIDDGNREAEAHPGVAVIAAVLSLAEEIGADGKNVISAIVSGYEVFVRVAKAILPSHLTRGFHTTGTVGAIASAAACAKLMDLNAEQIEKAVSLAATQAAGLLIVCESGQAAKPINPARAAQAGILSAKLAQANADAPENVFESAKGFVHAFSDSYRPYCLSEKLGSVYCVLDTYVKLYPSCRHTHATIEAIKKYISTYGHIGDAERIEIHTYPIAVDIVGHNTEPKTIGDVKFSIPYTAACVAMNDDYSLDDLAAFDLKRMEVIEYAKRIEVIAEERFDDIPNGIRGSEIVVIGKDGQTHSCEVPIAKGEGDNRISWDTLADKAASCCRVLSDQERMKLIDYCRALPQMKKFEQPQIVIPV